MANHLIVVSVDALVYEDLELLGKQPNVKRLLENGSLVRHMRTVYPSLTHIVHTTLMTGCTPDKTGIIATTLWMRCSVRHFFMQRRKRDCVHAPAVGR